MEGITIAIAYQQSSIVLGLDRAAITLSVGDQPLAADGKIILFMHHGCGWRVESPLEHQ